MKHKGRAGLWAGAAVLLLADAVFAQSPPQGVNGAAVVGLPGCESDVPTAATRQSITFTSQGRDVPALLYEPQGVPAAGAALVILHGRTIEEDVFALDGHAIQLASRGFPVILPFYLEAANGRDPSRAREAHRVWRRVALDAADALAVEAGMGMERVVLWGQTRGGGVALAAALEPGSPVGGAVGLNIGGAPQRDAQGAGRPFLLIHPARSRDLPPRQVRDMASAIHDRGGDVERLEVAHDFDRFEPADWCRVMDATRRLLERVASSNSNPAAG